MELVLYLHTWKEWGVSLGSSIPLGNWGYSVGTPGYILTLWPMPFRLSFTLLATWSPSLFKPLVLEEMGCVPYSFHPVSSNFPRMFLSNTSLSHHSLIHKVHFQQVQICHCHLMCSAPFLHCDSAHKIYCPSVKLEWFTSKTGMLGQISCKGMVLGKCGTLYTSIDCQKRDT